MPSRDRLAAGTVFSWGMGCWWGVANWSIARPQPPASSTVASVATANGSHRRICATPNMLAGIRWQDIGRLARLADRRVEDRDAQVDHGLLGHAVVLGPVEGHGFDEAHPAPDR